MRRKLTAILCAVVVLAGIFAPPASAAAPVYFTAVNDYVLDLSDDTMPFWHGGNLYVPGSLFNTKRLGTGFYSTRKMAILYGKTTDYALFFDLEAGTVRDSAGYGHYPPAIDRGGDIFVPLSMTCSFFSLTYSNTKVAHGYLIRVCSDSASLPDKTFADAAAYNMDVVYNQYLKSKEPPEEPDPVPPENQPPQAEGREVALCFHPESREELESVLTALDAREAAGTFYLTAEDIAAWGGLTRRLTATGHSVGLLADSGLELSVEDQLSRANDALWQAAGKKTRLCYLENAGPEDRTAASDAGYCLLDPDMDRFAGKLNGRSAAESLSSQLASRRGNASVWLGGGVSASGLQELLRRVYTAEDTAVGLRETWRSGT